MFENLKKSIIKNMENEINETRLFIEKGYCSDWRDKKESDNGLERYSTDKRWGQYQNGEINREQAVEYAIRRAIRQHDKRLNEVLEKLESVENADELDYIDISIDWVRSSVWGNNPQVEARIGGTIFTGHASGCGYDKESAAVAQALNKSDSVLKVLYTLKENGLNDGKTSNHDILGYGSGYGVLPAFEGGVGVSCFWRILEKAGYQIESHHGKKNDYYGIKKEVLK